MVGDSLTERCQWQEMFPNHKVLNRGIGSDITEGLIHRLESIIKHKPYKIFIMIGINDLAKKIPITTVCSNIKKFICQLRDKLPASEIYIQSVLPIEQHNLVDEKSIKFLNQQYKEISAELRVIYIDLYHSFVNGDLKQLISSDGLHLSSKGYELWLNLISQFVE